MLEEIPQIIQDLNPWEDYQPTGNLTTTALVILAIITSIHLLGWLYIFLGKEPTKWVTKELEKPKLNK